MTRHRFTERLRSTKAPPSKPLVEAADNEDRRAFPGHSDTATVSYLQRTVGNAATLQLLSRQVAITPTEHTIQRAVYPGLPNGTQVIHGNKQGQILREVRDRQSYEVLFMTTVQPQISYSAFIKYNELDLAGQTGTTQGQTQQPGWAVLDDQAAATLFGSADFNNCTDFAFHGDVELEYQSNALVLKRAAIENYNYEEATSVDDATVILYGFLPGFGHAIKKHNGIWYQNELIPTPLPSGGRPYKIQQYSEQRPPASHNGEPIALMLKKRG